MDAKMVFTIQAHGYCPENVDTYVEQLAGEYETLCKEHTRLTDDFNKLAANYQILRNAKTTLAEEASRLLERNAALLQTIGEIRNGMRALFRNDSDENEETSVEVNDG